MVLTAKQWAMGFGLSALLLGALPMLPLSVSSTATLHAAELIDHDSHMIPARLKLFQHLLSLSPGFFSRTSTGELMARFNEVHALQTALSNSLVTIIKEPVTVISLAAFLLAATAGYATLWMVVVADMGTSLLVIFNGLRLLSRNGDTA